MWVDVMSRQPRVRASRASPAQTLQGLRVVLFQKLFKGNILSPLEKSDGQYVF